MNIPAIVLVTGHPGTGKITLAEALAQELKLPLTCRDQLKETLLNTLGWSTEEWANRLSVASWTLLYQQIERLLSASVDQIVNTNFWGTPLYFRDALQRWPERHAAVISASACAKPGGVLFHCGRGYDRTGIISLLVLALAGVTLEEIAADYELSVDAFRDELLAKENSSVQQALHETLAGRELESYLTYGGASPADIAALRQRLLGIN